MAVAHIFHKKLRYYSAARANKDVLQSSSSLTTVQQMEHIVSAGKVRDSHPFTPPSSFRPFHRPRNALGEFSRKDTVGWFKTLNSRRYNYYMQEDGQGIVENIRCGESEGFRKLDYFSGQRKIIIALNARRVSSLPCRDVRSSATLLRRYDTRSAKKHVGKGT
jgi:hypothetical protein